MQRTHLPDLVQRARQLFEASKASGRFPLIDCSDLDVGDYCLDLSWSFYDPGVLETARSECETLLAQDPNDLPCRFVVLRIFFTLTYWRFPEKESEVSAFRSASRQHFAELVRLRDVSACVDKRDIEWEIVNACAVFDWERASQLHDLLRRYSESQEETILCYLEKGRLLFLSVILGQDSFEDDGEIEEPMLSPDESPRSSYRDDRYRPYYRRQISLSLNRGKRPPARRRSASSEGPGQGRKRSCPVLGNTCEVPLHARALRRLCALAQRSICPRSVQDPVL
jgi:hypothetical protein